MAIPSTTERVPAHTAESVNTRIEEEMLIRLEHYQAHPEKIDSRLRELDREWDIERALEANASTLALGGILLAMVGRRKALLLSAGVSAFLLQHAVQGWCPPVPLLRRLGFRTAKEIETERYALKAWRGDLDEIRHDGDIGQTVSALERPAQEVVSPPV